MTRRVPIVATVVVLAAVVVMIALGFWQLDRKAEKEALLAEYARAQTMSSDVAWPHTGADVRRSLYRHAVIECAGVESIQAVAGRSLAGRTGWAHIARCRLPDGGVAAVAIGWSEGPESPQWAGGQVGGIIGPAAANDIRLTAAPAQAGLEQLAAPDPANIPNNHLSYAVQWFAFAATAVVIYFLALRSRHRR